jgi:hypothetical protein
VAREAVDAQVEGDTARQETASQGWMVVNCRDYRPTKKCCGFLDIDGGIPQGSEIKTIQSWMINDKFSSFP